MTRIARVVLAAAALSACAPAVRTAGPAPAEAAALLRTADRRAFDEALLRAALGDRRPEVRRRALWTAANLRDARAVPLVSPLLSDRDTAVAATAAFALGQIGDTAAVPALAAVARADLAARRPTVVGEAAYALGKLPSEGSKAALTELLAGLPLRDDDVREAAGSALLAIWRQARPVSTETIARWLDSDDAELRWRAAYALARRPDPRGTALLADAMDDADPLVRSFAARALTSTLADSAGITADAALALLLPMAMEDAEMAPRINAIRTLGTWRHPRAVEVLADLAVTGAPSVSITAMESLGRLGTFASSAADDLRAEAMDADMPVAVRTTALAALAAVDSAAGRRTADAFLRADDWRLRAAAARALPPGPESRARLLALAADPDGRVAAAAVEAGIAAAGDSVAQARALLLAGLRAPDVVARTNALGGLARVAEPSTLPLVFDAYARARADSLNDAALAAVGAVAAIARKDSTAWPRFFARFPRSGDDGVRRRVAAALGDSIDGPWGAPLPIETGLSMDDYRRIVAASRAEPRPRAVIETERGEIEVELFADDAPLTVRSFLALAEAGFFDGQRWPRVVPNFVIQGGDPRGDTSGGPGYSIRDEINRHRYGRGTLGMALSGPDTGGSQWFITHSPQPHLDGTYAVFGRVVRGMDVVDGTLAGDRIIRIREVR